MQIKVKDSGHDEAMRWDESSPHFTIISRAFDNVRAAPIVVTKRFFVGKTYAFAATGRIM